MQKFTLDQNNAGGFFLPNTPRQITFHAVDLDDAYAQARAYGIDFADGCNACCGSRWNFVFYGTETEVEDAPEYLYELRRRGL